MKFNEKLVQLILNSGITKEEIATKLNVTIDILNSWELGQTIPDNAKLNELATLFNVDLSEYMTKDVVVNKEFINNNIIHLNEEELKPRRWLLYVLIVVEIVIVIILADKFITNLNEKREDKKSIFDIFNFENINSIIEDSDVDSFNWDFEMYNGTQYKMFTSNLIDKIVTNNKTNPKHLITVKYGDLTTNVPNEIKNIKTNLKDNNKYEISFEYDENGFIYEVLFEELEEDISTRSFNLWFESYSGSSNGILVKNMIDEVIKSNKKYNKHIIRIIYKSTNTTDENTIRNIKQQIGDAWSNYEVILDYDEAGYVYQITIQG